MVFLGLGLGLQFGFQFCVRFRFGDLHRYLLLLSLFCDQSFKSVKIFVKFIFFVCWLCRFSTFRDGFGL